MYQELGTRDENHQEYIDAIEIAISNELNEENQPKIQHNESQKVVTRAIIPTSEDRH